MSDATKRLKANRALESKPCGWCAKLLTFGEDSAVCLACEATHHAACWDGKGGCSNSACLHAPLKEMKLPPSAAPLPAGKTSCPHCGALMDERWTYCRRCKRAPTPDGLYHGPKENAPGAVAAMVWGIVGLFICGIILGIFALTKSASARRLIADNPTLGGAGMARAGQVLGIIAIVFWGLMILSRLGGE